MRQVPNYLLIGNGRAAHHFQHYFSLLRLPYQTWHRGEGPDKLQKQIREVSHILLLISDRAIEKFAARQLADTSARLIHFSGSVVSEKIIGAHPLMSFSDNLYEAEHYERIPFVIDHDAPDFADVLPGVPNQHVRLHKALKPKYHALCVLSGNFSCLLWQKLFAGFNQEFNIPAELAFPYLRQQMHNLCNDAAHALTGPLVRDDWQTVAKNLAALDGDPFQKIYESFANAYPQIKEKL